MKKIISTLKDFIAHFSEDEIMSHSSSVAFYTLFSLPSMLMVIIFIANILAFGSMAGDDIFSKLSGFVGSDSADQLKSTISEVEIEESHWFQTTVSIVVLIISATGLLGSLQQAFNAIWKVKPKDKAGYLKVLWSRLISLGMLILIGFLFAASLLLDTILAKLGTQLESRFSNFSASFAVVVNEVIALVFLTLLFAALFKVLPDKKIKWKNIWIGSFFTALMFSIGKFAIGFYLGNSTVSSPYGAAGSMVVVLIWIYYLTIILLTGVVFTKMYTNYYDKANAVPIEEKKEE